MPSFTLEFEVFCARCGAGLCRDTDTRESRSRGMPQAVVEPCERCLADARNEAFCEGDSKGYERGYADGEASQS